MGKKRWVKWWCSLTDEERFKIIDDAYEKETRDKEYSLIDNLDRDID